MVGAPKDSPRSPADVLYGEKPSASPPKPAAKTPSPKSSPDATGSDEAPEDRFYGGAASALSSYRPHLADAFNHFRDATGMNAADAEAELTAAAIAFSDARIAPEEAARLHALVLQHALAPADDTMIAGWATETRRELRQRYGKDADSRLAAAKAFVDARPGLKALQNASGVGSHPDIVLALAENPHALRMTPRTRKVG
jgi:hypothetical protein